MTPWTGHPLPLVLSAQSVTVPVLSVILTGIGVVLLIGLALTYAVRRRPLTPVSAEAERRQLEDLLSDADELAGRLAANLDAKAARLERLIAQADERLARMERAAAEARPRTERRPASEPDEAGPLNRRVYDLADRGLQPVEIARQLSQQVGQVELILALRRP
jgi:hypothetical protein